MLQTRLRYKEKSPDLVVHSERMRSILDLVRKVASSNAIVLVTGESGTGKELIANTIHHYSQRCNGPFIDISCAAIQETLLESELFGYEPGAFTGAQKRKLGLLELANHGTLFLDEIGEMNLTLQSKLLRVLETQSFYRVGGTKKVEIDVRIVAATNRELDKDVIEGKFRGDLLYRINNFTIKLPPLRERPEDIRPIAERFLAQIRGHKPIHFTEEAMHTLVNYDWPGNVRELRNVVERAVILSSDDEIRSEDLPIEVRRDTVEMFEPSVVDATIPVNLDELKKKQILTVLEQTGWHQGKASEALGISPSTLYRQLKSLGLTRTRRIAEL